MSHNNMIGKCPDGVGDRVERPWGWYEVLTQGDNYQVKRIYVAPGQRLSYQSHVKRAEVWTVVVGTVRVTLDGVETNHPKGSVIHIDVGVRHRLANLGTDDAYIIEIQTGTYLGEDDIVRYDDDYGRLI